MKYTDEYLKGFANGFVDCMVMYGHIQEGMEDKAREDILKKLMEENETKEKGKWW